MSDLLNEILLRVGKALLAALIGALFYVAALVLGASGSPELAIVCWIAGAAVVLVFQGPPF